MTMLPWFGVHHTEIVIGAVFALLFGLVFEFLSVGSRTRTGIRHLRNKWAEHSVAKLRKRIGQLEYYRERMMSDKGLYLLLFNYVLFSLTSISLGSLLLIGSRTDVIFGLSLRNEAAICNSGAVVFFLLATFAGALGLPLSYLDTRQRINRMVQSLAGEIEKLKRALAAKTQAKSPMIQRISPSDVPW